MPVDAEFQKLLDLINAMPQPDYARQPALEIACQSRAAPITIPPVPQPVRVESRGVKGPGGYIPIRIYRPDGPGPFGAMVSFHGGGWVTGKLDSDEYKSHVLARASGVAIVSVEYRLAPEHKFPAAAEDCYAVTEWTAKNAAALGLDAKRIGVGGSSAGGNLSAAVALMCRDRSGPALAFQLLTYPVIDDDFDRPSYRDNPKGKVISREQMAWFWDQYAPGTSERGNPYLNPLCAKDLKGLPPALVITAEFDPLRDEGEAYAKRLSEAGVEVRLSRYDGCVHGFLSIMVLHRKSQAALAETAAAMRRYLG
jgi:acetyl esterase